MASGIARRSLTHSQPRIALVQFNPKFCAVEQNINTARRLCAQLQPGSVDLVCLSEMVFTGYLFKDANSIKPYLEVPREGPTSRFCAELATNLKCHVVAGYPERLSPAEYELGIDHTGDPVTKIGANSAILYGPGGKFIGNYRKTNLFETDTTWSKPGTGFVTFYLPPPLNTVSLAICMDINVQPPRNWDSLDGPYELADYCLSQRSDTLILVNAWLATFDDDYDESAWGTLNFWAQRLRPLWIGEDELSNPADNLFSGDDAVDSTTESSQTNIVICNRTGEENGAIFCGTSAFFKMTRTSGRPKLLQVMGKDEEGVRVCNF